MAAIAACERAQSVANASDDLTVTCGTLEREINAEELAARQWRRTCWQLYGDTGLCSQGIVSGINVRSNAIRAIPGRWYEIKSGDSLTSIAREALGRASEWSSIYSENRSVLGVSPDAIQPGQRIFIPESSRPDTRE
jgi:hypothetical protein